MPNPHNAIPPHPIQSLDKTSQTALFPAASAPSPFIIFIRLVARLTPSGIPSSQPLLPRTFPQISVTPVADTPPIGTGNRILSHSDIRRVNTSSDAFIFCETSFLFLTGANRAGTRQDFDPPLSAMSSEPQTAGRFLREKVLHFHHPVDLQHDPQSVI